MLLKRGYKGWRVKQLQNALRKLGYNIWVDGDFGEGTEDDVKDFQYRNKLDVDGLVGKNTARRIEEASGVKLFQDSPPLPDKVSASSILLSAGHSTVPPRDSGSVGNGFVEAKEALKIRDALADKLTAKGREVFEDGTDGESLPLRKAISLARSVTRKGGIALEFHFNAFSKASANGVEVLSKKKDKKLAQVVAGAISESTGIKLRGDKGWKPENSGQHHRLGFVQAGGLVVEVGFISNATDMHKYTSNFSRMIDKLAEVL